MQWCQGGLYRECEANNDTRKKTQCGPQLQELPLAHRPQLAKELRAQQGCSESQVGHLSANFQVRARLTLTNINTAHGTSNKQICTGKRAWK